MVVCQKDFWIATQLKIINGYLLYLNTQQMTMDMLHRDKLMAILLLFFLFSCSKKKDDTEVYLMFSKNIIGGNTEYKRVYTSVTDTLINWKKHKLIGTSELCSYSNFHIDSLLCFNNEKNKMVSAILESECKQDLSDGIKIFYGAKIKDKWCFFSGAYIVLPREIYQKETYTPLSFEKLHEIAMKEIFSNYLKKKDKGFLENLFGKTEYEINDDFFSDLTSVAWCIDCKTQEQWNAAYLKVVKENWEKDETIQNVR